MADDTSLTDFLTGTESSDRSETRDQQEIHEQDDNDRADDDSSSTAQSTPTVTFAWSAETRNCPECDQAVERRWQQGGALVCVDCKNW